MPQAVEPSALRFAKVESSSVFGAAEVVLHSVPSYT